MAGLNLTSAVQNYYAARDDKMRRDEIERQMERRRKLEEANGEAGRIIDASKAEWAMSGAQGTYKPSDETMLAAAEARGTALARAGLWDEYAKNEVTLAPQKLRIRASALEGYEADGDFGRFIGRFYPTIFDGKRVVGVEKMTTAPSLESMSTPGSERQPKRSVGGDVVPTANTGDGPAPDMVGVAAGKPMFKVKLDDGTEKVVDPEAVIKRAKMMLLDPVQTARAEYEAGLKRWAATHEADEKVRVEREKGAQDRQTDAQKGERESLDSAAERASRERVAGINAQADRDVAETRAKADRYVADKNTDKKAGTTRDKVADFKAVHDEVTRVIGERNDSLMGSGGRISNEDTTKIANFAKALIEEEGADPGDAINRAIEEWKKRRAKPKGDK